MIIKQPKWLCYDAVKRAEHHCIRAIMCSTCSVSNLILCTTTTTDDDDKSDHPIFQHVLYTHNTHTDIWLTIKRRREPASAALEARELWINW